MKTKLLLTFLFALLMSGLNAQDIIIKKNGDEIKAKILEAGINEIKYKKFDNAEGPTYVLDKSEIFLIKYADGTKTVVNRMDVPEASAQKKEIMNEKRIFKKQKSFVSAGYGFGVYSGIVNYYNGNSEGITSSLTGPGYVKYEYAVSDEFGIGLNLAYLTFKFSYPAYGYYNGSSYQNIYTETDTYTSWSGLFRANWHFGASEKVDPYFGFGFGYRSAVMKHSTNDPQGTIYYQSYYSGYDNFWGSTSGNGNSLGFETTFGIRIMFTERLGAYAEAGIAKSVVQVGLTAKF